MEYVLNVLLIHTAFPKQFLMVQCLGKPQLFEKNQSKMRVDNIVKRSEGLIHTNSAILKSSRKANEFKHC